MRSDSSQAGQIIRPVNSNLGKLDRELTMIQSRSLLSDNVSGSAAAIPARNRADVELCVQSRSKAKGSVNSN